MKKIIIIMLLIPSIISCGKSDGDISRHADVSIKFEQVEDDRRFVQLIADYAKESHWTLDGPEVRPGDNDDDYIATITKANDFTVLVNTTDTESIVVFYCSMAGSQKEKDSKLRAIVKDVLGMYFNEYSDYEISLQRYDTEEFEYLADKNDKLEYVIENAATCK